MNKENRVMMEVSSPEELVFAICLARNAFLQKVKICVDNSKREFHQKMIPEIKDIIMGLYSLECGYFPTAQTKQYELRMQSDVSGLRAEIELTTNYMISEKECNDFTCIATEISALIGNKCGPAASDRQKIETFASWVNQHFQYKRTNSYEDHSAAGLLQNRTGVCQAIAAMAVKILPYMGIETQYVSGKGRGAGGEWGNHAWNLLKMNDGRWIQADFTYAFDSPVIPMTDSELQLRRFERNHRWKEGVLSERAIETRAKLHREIENSEILLMENENYFSIQGVKIFTQMPVYRKKDGREYLAITEVLPYLGGACEWEPGTDTMRICTGNRIMILSEASRMGNLYPGMFDRKILDICEIQNAADQNKLVLTFEKKTV